MSLIFNFELSGHLFVQRSENQRKDSKMSQMRVFMISLLAAIVAGCASTTIPDPDVTDGGMDSSSGGASTGGY